jgi:predicted nicotinamide N-methyase
VSEPLDRADQEGLRRFIAENTELLKPPLVPEIVLHLAVESLPIWQKTEEELDEMNVAPPYWAFAWAGGQALARYLLDNPDVCRGQSVLDLGSGSGLVAVEVGVRPRRRRRCESRCDARSRRRRRSTFACGRHA